MSEAPSRLWRLAARYWGYLCCLPLLTLPHILSDVGLVSCPLPWQAEECAAGRLAASGVVSCGREMLDVFACSFYRRRVRVVNPTRTFRLLYCGCSTTRKKG